MRISATALRNCISNPNFVRFEWLGMARIYSFSQKIGSVELYPLHVGDAINEGAFSFDVQQI